MPTKRAFIFLIIALALYFLANQTQVGWIYVITDGIVGLLIVTFLYSRGMLKAVQAQRTLHSPSPNPDGKNGGETPDFNLPTFYEDDPIEVSLQFNNIGFRPAFLVNGHERCPFAPPADQAQPLFVPSLFKNDPVTLSYQTSGYRRGLYAFPKLHLQSKGPFGFFTIKQTLTAPAEILIYPQYHPLKRLRLWETKELAERQTSKMGPGSQVIGTREYRPGDLLRQIHWRSTARAGRLVVKEFAEDEQLSLTVVLDLESDSSLGEGKYSTFETAVRIAASFGYYATRKNIPFRLAGASPKWTPPPTPLSWWAILNYLAKVENDGQKSLAQVLGNLPPAPFVVVLVSNPDRVTAGALTGLQQKGAQTLAILITPKGDTPPMTEAVTAGGVTLKSVTPFNWAEMLADL